MLFKSPLRCDPDDQNQALRQLHNEINLLSGPLRGVEGVRQVVDEVDLQDESTTTEVRAGVFEYLEIDLHKFHFTDKGVFKLDQTKACARQLLEGLCEMHKKNIIHTGSYVHYNNGGEHILMSADLKMENVAFSIPKTKLFRRTPSDPLFKILDFGVGEFRNHISSANRNANLRSCLCTRGSR